MSAPAPYVIGENLFHGALRAYEEIQNVRLLVRGASLALDAADDDEDRIAAQEILQAAVLKCDGIMSALNAANDADAVILAERERLRRAGGGR